jgi:hypothetical protein
VLPVAEETVLFGSGLLAVERRRRGTRPAAGAELLSPSGAGAVLDCRRGPG